jgi:hypothetical protein
LKRLNKLKLAPPLQFEPCEEGEAYRAISPSERMFQLPFSSARVLSKLNTAYLRGKVNLRNTKSLSVRILRVPLLEQLSLFWGRGDYHALVGSIQLEEYAALRVRIVALGSCVYKLLVPAGTSIRALYTPFENERPIMLQIAT